jgi:Tfp pilus assembly protein PilP
MSIARTILFVCIAASVAVSSAAQTQAAAGSAAKTAVGPVLEKTSAATPDVSAIKPMLPPTAIVDTHKYSGRRDPFVNPIVRQANEHSGNCTTGKRCLVIGQITLKGIIVADGGILAIVENAATRTYFLRVNDPLFDGVVEHITRDSITFRENVSDSLGRPLGTREVVKKIVAPAA